MERNALILDPEDETIDEPDASEAPFEAPKTHVDPNALSTIMDIVRRLQERGGSLIGQTDPFNKMCSSYW